MHKTTKDKTRAVLVGIELKSDKTKNKKESVRELALLARTAGIEVEGSYIQKRDHIDKATYAGSGFLAGIVTDHDDVDLVIFDNELSPTQSLNIEKKYGIKVIDRTEVILTIFHQHARTREARLQVELAELNYQLPRLKKLWSHLDRERGQASGSRGVARGMGEKQIEVDRRRIIQQITRTRKQLKKIEKQRHTRRRKGETENHVCLVGYTNAGKSTLFNRFTDAGVLVEDKLFATLDSTARRLPGDLGHDLIVSDTVGFISNLPHHLVASFHSTLLDVKEADLLIHVVDGADTRFRDHIRAVEEVLRKIGADSNRSLLVLNKVDLISADERVMLKEEFPDSIQVSALTGYNLRQLKEVLEEIMKHPGFCELFIPLQDQQEINQLHELGKIITQEYNEKGVKIKALLSGEDLRIFRKYRINGDKDENLQY